MPILKYSRFDAILSGRKNAIIGWANINTKVIMPTTPWAPADLLQPPREAKIVIMAIVVISTTIDINPRCSVNHAC